MNLPAVLKPSTRLLAVLSALIVAVLIADAVTAATKGSSGSEPGKAAAAHASSSPTAVPAPRDIVLFTDDFDDVGTGWANETTKSGSSFRYVRGKYVALLKDRYAEEFLYAPYHLPIKALKATVRAAQTGGSSTASGFGVLCVQGNGRTEVSYNFVVLRSSASTVRWVIRRQDGSPKVNFRETDLTGGTLPLRLSATPLTLTAECLTRLDDRTTRLTFNVNGRAVGHATNTVSKDLPRGGWNSGFMVVSTGTTTTVTATHFDMRSAALTAG